MGSLPAPPFGGVGLGGGGMREATNTPVALPGVDTTSALPTVRPTPSWSKARRALGNWLFVLPAIALILTTAIYPLVFSLRLSFSRYDLARPRQIPVGLDNYRAAFADQYVHNATGNTAVFVVGALAAQVVLGLALALLLNMRLPGRSVLRAAFTLPMMFSTVVAAMNFKVLLHPTYGLYNWLLRFVLGDGFVGDWLASPRTALPTLMVVDTWQWTPFMFLIFLAGLQALPVEPFEAAELDGASKLQQFRDLTLPLMRNVIVAAVLIRLIDLLKIFDVVYILTEGGPGIGSETISFLIYKTAFKFRQVGLASAYSYLFLIVVTVLATLAVRVLWRKTASAKG